MKLIKYETGFKLGVAQYMSVEDLSCHCQFHFVLYVFGIRKLNKSKIWTLLDIDVVFMKLMD